MACVKSTVEMVIGYRFAIFRISKVVGNILGKGYQCVLGSDFYSAYKQIKALAKQRCLGHLLAEIKKIQENNKFAAESIEEIFFPGIEDGIKREN